mgnify:FL=1
MKSETKLWQELKKKTPLISWTRLESWASLGVPDLLGYTDNKGFFTVELKVINSKKIRFSPHQISFHIKHAKSSYILAKTLDPLSYKLYPGSSVLALSQGEPVRELAANWPEIQKKLIHS